MALDHIGSWSEADGDGSVPLRHWPGRWTTAPVAIAGSIDDHCRYLTALRGAPGQASGDPVWVVMLAGIAECEHPSVSLRDTGFDHAKKWYGFDPAFDGNLRALRTQTINSTLSSQTCGKIEPF